MMRSIASPSRVFEQRGGDGVHRPGRIGWQPGGLCPGEFEIGRDRGRRAACGLTKPSAKRAARSAGILSFIMAEDRIRVLTEAPRIKPTLARCHSAWQPNRQRLHLSTRRFCSDNRGQLYKHKN